LINKYYYRMVDIAFSIKKIPFTDYFSKNQIDFDKYFKYLLFVYILIISAISELNEFISP